MTEADLPRVAEIAAACYPQHFEDVSVFAERLRLYPAGCLALATSVGGVQGYILSYPWVADYAPPLNSLLGRLPEAASVYYLHDLAVAPPARGRGQARAGLEALVDGLHGFAMMTLVSVNDTVGFWEHLGFVVRRTADLDRRLASYGSDARFMERALTPGA